MALSSIVDSYDWAMSMSALWTFPFRKGWVAKHRHYVVPLPGNRVPQSKRALQALPRFFNVPSFCSEVGTAPNLQVPGVNKTGNPTSPITSWDWICTFGNLKWLDMLDEESSFVDDVLDYYTLGAAHSLVPALLEQNLKCIHTSWNLL